MALVTSSKDRFCTLAPWSAWHHPHTCHISPKDNFWGPSGWCPNSQPWGVRVPSMQAFCSRLQYTLGFCGHLVPRLPWWVFFGKESLLCVKCWQRGVCPCHRQPVLPPLLPTSILLLEGVWAQAGCGGPLVELCLWLASRPRSSWAAWLTALSPCILGSRTSSSCRTSNVTVSGWKVYHFWLKHRSKVHRCCSQILLFFCPPHKRTQTFLHPATELQ